MADLPTLDLAAVLQASQALSSFLELDELLVKIPQILVQHSGSDRCLLALPDAQDDWLIRAIATPDHPQLCSETLSQSHHCPVELLQSVSRTQQTVVIDGSKIEPATTIWHDPAPRPQSGFCHPLRHQDELLGILYLEHRTTPGVFTGDRQSVIRLLCNQAAISLHNSRRYNQKEQKSQRWQKVAAKLEKSQTRFRELFEASADAAIILDDGLIVDCNRAAVEMMGYTDKNRLLSLNPAQISPEFQPDGQASAEKAGTMITLAMTHGSHRFEWVCQRFNGENFWVEVVLTLMPEKDRLVFHAIWRDISDRKVAEAALLKSEAKMRQLIERTADAILLLDAETLVFTEANQAAADLMGFKDPSQIIGLSPLDFSPEIQPDGIPSREKIQISQEPLLAQGNARFEWLCNRQNGEQIWLEVILTLMTTEEKPSLHCVWRDIHDRKMAEAASQRYQERLRFLVEQTPIAIIEWDANAKVVGWNPAAETIFGYSASEMLDQDLRKVVPELDRALVAKVIQSLFEQRGGSYSVNQNLCKDGSLITCEWINTPLRDAEDNVIGVFSMAQNITDRENAKAEILQKSQELEQTLQELQHTQLQMVQGEKMASLGNLVAGVAHEINNPIGFLNGSIKNTKDYIQDLFDYLDVYQQHQPPTAPVQDSAEDIELEFILEDLPNMLNSMQGATDRIKAISNSLRTFSRADTENKVKADLHEGLDSTLLILKYRLKANEQRPAIEVIKNYGELPDIDCFPGQLNQVFMNLLANAIDAFDEANQGKSFAEIKAAPNQITLCTKVIENQVEIQIQDNGCGMKPEIQARIFEQGFTTKAVGEGTGLGMAIARQIIMEKHSGSLECSSELGQGTTFIIILPC